MFFARKIVLWLTTVLFCLVARVALAQPVSLDSFNVASSHPLTVGKWKTNKQKINAHLLFPTEVKDKYPAILYLLSAGGFGPADQAWIDLFLKSGYAVLWVDQYSTRGMQVGSGLSSAQTEMSDMSYLHDASSGFKFLKAEPRIDTARIAGFGRSWGATLLTYMADGWYAANAMDGDVPKLRIGLFPACYTSTKSSNPTRGKTYLFMGGADDMAYPKPCVDFMERIAKAGGQTSVKIYPTAWHGFDNVEPFSRNRIAGYGTCHGVWDTESMVIDNMLDGTSHNLKDGTWGKVYSKCSGMIYAKFNGSTSESRKLAEQDVMRVLAENL